MMIMMMIVTSETYVSKVAVKIIFLVGNFDKT